jgi:hypothetical protein
MGILLKKKIFVNHAPAALVSVGAKGMLLPCFNGMVSCLVEGGGVRRRLQLPELCIPNYFCAPTILGDRHLPQFLDHMDPVTGGRHPGVSPYCTACLSSL